MSSSKCLDVESLINSMSIKCCEKCMNINNNQDTKKEYKNNIKLNYKKISSTFGAYEKSIFSMIESECQINMFYDIFLKYISEIMTREFITIDILRHADKIKTKAKMNLNNNYNENNEDKYIAACTYRRFIIFLLLTSNELERNNYMIG